MFFSHAIQGAFILDVLQIGWRAAPDGVTGWLKALLGCLLTVAATGLVAPVWFDLLDKVPHLVGAGRVVPRQ